MGSGARANFYLVTHGAIASGQKGGDFEVDDSVEYSIRVNRGYKLPPFYVRLHNVIFNKVYFPLCY